MGPREDTGDGRSAVVRIAAVLLALLALVPAGEPSAQQLEVIELRHRLADEVLPTLQPLVEPGGVLTGTGSTLFVRTSPENFGQIREAVALLDRKPRELVISVGQGTVETVDDAGIRGSAAVAAGDVEIGVNRPPSEGAVVAVQARQVTQRANLQNVSSVRTLEGSEAYIAVGEVVPLSTTQVVPGHHGPIVYESTGYRDVSTGFYATARVNGDVVTLEVSPRQQRMRGNGHGMSIDTSGIVSSVSGRLGEWLPLGAVSEAGVGGTGGLLVWGRRSAESRYAAWVKVDEAQ